MTTYVIRRVLLIIPTLIISSLLVFLMIRLIPGSAVDIMMSRMDLTTAWSEDQRQAVMRELGIDKPIWVQYGDWMKGIITRGDLGTRLKVINIGLYN